MAELRLKSSRFRAEREADWRRLEALLKRAESGSLRRLSSEEILAIPVLYRSTLSSLSVARATSLDQSLIDYLEALSTRAYFFVYGTRSNLWRRLAQFFAQDWPAAAKDLWRETAVSTALFVIGAIAAFALVNADPSWFSAFVDPDLAGGRDPQATRESLRSMLYDGGGKDAGLSAFSSYLFTHNAQVAIMAFALGFAFCLLTAMLMVMNGLMLGAFFALYLQHGLGVELGGWILIHGVTELLAVTLAGAAGLHIGWAVIFPGERTRIDAAARAGRKAAVLMGGVVVMLFCAGLLEGFGRQLITSDIARYAIAAASAVIWGAYLYGPRRARPA